ncbi:hypothetical protein [Streptosporangium sp. CA-115845]|uniref:hypothetical protein n=1 Tax=Streptosporangium sp. CA-115845 TaxID=3240071 RepID=UPI003D90C96B
MDPFPSPNNDRAARAPTGTASDVAGPQAEEVVDRAWWGIGTITGGRPRERVAAAPGRAVGTNLVGQEKAPARSGERGPSG